MLALGKIAMERGVNFSEFIEGILEESSPAEESKLEERIGRRV